MIPAIHDRKIFFSIGCITLLALLLVNHIPTYWLPEPEGDILYIHTTFPGATPFQVEQNVTVHLERSLSTVSGIKEIYSRSGDGFSSISLTFKNKYDLSLREQEIRSILRKTKANFPQGVSVPFLSVQENGLRDRQNILTLAISYTDTTTQIMEKFASPLNRFIAHLDQIARFEVIGMPEEKLEIIPDPARILRYNLNWKDIREKITAINHVFSYRMLFVDGYETSLLLNGPPIGIQNLPEMILKENHGTMVRLKDIATITPKPLSSSYKLRINGQDKILIQFYGYPETNEITLANHILSQIGELKDNLPPEWEVLVLENNGALLTTELFRQLRLLLMSIGFVVLSLWLFTGKWRVAFVLLLALFSNILILICLMGLFRISIHLLSISAWGMAFGLMVDQNMYVFDIIRRSKSTDGLIRILLATIVTTIGCLASILLAPEALITDLQDFLIIVGISAVSASTNAIIVIPALARLSVLSSANKHKNTNHLIQVTPKFFFLFRLYTFRKTILLSAVLMVGIPFYLLPVSIDESTFFSRYYNVTIGSSLYQNEIRPYTDKLFGGVSRLFFLHTYERPTKNSESRTALKVSIKMSPNRPAADLEKITSQWDNWLRDDFLPKYIEHFRTELISDFYAEITIFFTNDTEKAKLHYWIKTRLEEYALSFGDIQYHIYGIGPGFSTASATSARFYIQLTGYDYDQLNRITSEICSKLKYHPRVIEIDSLSQVSFDDIQAVSKSAYINYTKLSLLDIPISEVTQALDNYSLEANIQYLPFYSDKGFTEDIPVLMKWKNFESFDIFALHHTYLPNKYVSISSLIDFKSENKTSDIHRKNKAYIRNISFEYSGSFKFGNDFLNSTVNTWKLLLPPGFSIKIVNPDFRPDETESFLPYLLLFILAFVLVFCVIFFESFSLGFWAFSTIPVSFSGLFLTFYLFNIPYDKGFYASLIFLSGISVNNSILLLHSLKMIKDSTPYSIFLEHTNKLLPIWISTLSTCVSLIPILLNPEIVFWFNLAAGVCGGLLFSTIILSLTGFLMIKPHQNRQPQVPPI